MPRAYEQGYDKGPLRINTFDSPVITGGIEWRDGNTWNVPVNGSIADAITAATAGDTIQLGAGTYTITSTLTVNKKLHIKGMGRGITTIACATADISMITTTTETGSAISDLTIVNSAAHTTSPYLINPQVSTDIYNVDFNITATTASGTVVLRAIGQSTGGSNVNVRDCVMVSSGVIGGAYFIANSGTGTWNAYNCRGTVSGTAAGGGVAPRVYINSHSSGTLNLYDCYGTNSVNIDGGVVACANGNINVYGGAYNASGENGKDVYRNAGTLTLYDTTLVNNKTYGTITYGGTATSAISRSGQFRLNALNTAPSAANDTGTLGEIRIVDGFIYICTATDTWQRVAIATWE